MKKMLLCCLLLFAPGAFGMSGHPDDLPCSTPVAINGAWDMVDCVFSAPPYLPGSAIQDYPAQFVIPNPLPPTKQLRLRIWMPGFSAAPDYCEPGDFNGSQPGYITIKVCPGHYAHLNDHQISGQNQLGWWGVFDGDENNAWRLGLMISKAVDLWGPSIDLMAGIEVTGSSYGGTGAILQSIMMRDLWWRHFITEVDAQVPNTLFVKQDPSPVLAGPCCPACMARL